MSGQSVVHRVVAIAYDRLCTFEFGIAAEIFGLPRPEFTEWYGFSVWAADEGPMRASGGYRLLAERDGSLLDAADTIVVPGWRDIRERPPEDLIEVLRRANARGVRLVSLCSGAFVLAAAGLLDGRRATTHWRYAEVFRELYPRVDLDPDVLFVDGGDVLTAAGSAAGIDLCLHLVRRDFGTKAANHVARRLVVPPQREGGQAQYVEAPVAAPRRGAIGPLLDWIRKNLRDDLGLDRLARRANMSRRTFLRRFRAATGMTPARWIAQERVRLARTLLETTPMSIEEVGEACGFGSAPTFRLRFGRIVGVPPARYRERFRMLPG